MSSADSARPTTAPGISAEQRRKVRRTTWVVSLIALAFYIGYIVMTGIRAH